MRFDRVALAMLLTIASGCTIEPTPREYIDRPLITDDIQSETRDMIGDRLRLVVQSLAAGDPSAAHSALAPAPDVRVYGPGVSDRFEGAPQIESLLDLIASTQPDRLDIRQLDVQIGPRGTVGWFAAMLSYGDTIPTDASIRVTGVYRSREGDWELSQAHVSIAGDGIMARYPAERRPPAAAESPRADDPTRSGGS